MGKWKILVLNGPNLNLLGQRDPQIYGRDSLADIEARLRERAAQLDVELRFFQSNHEGELIDKLHEARHWADGVIINGGALSHYSYALADALLALEKPVVEVHLSNVFKREEWRRHSVLAPACVGFICGFGSGSYLLALEGLLQKLEPLDRERGKL